MTSTSSCGAERLSVRMARGTAFLGGEINVGMLIDEDETELAVRGLHAAYGLDAEDAAA